jgi:hypothetical protein
MRRFVTSTMCAALALTAAACGDPDATGSSSAAPPTSVSTIPPTAGTPTTAPAPTTTLPGSGNEGGFGAPAIAEGEFEAPWTVRIGGTVALLPNGCWTLSNHDAGLILFPPGTSYGADPTELVLPDGAIVGDGDVVTGHGVAVYGIDQLPGGPDGKWGNYATFCGVEQLVAAMDLGVRFEPARDEAAQMVAGLTVGSFVTNWGCGYGFVTSTGDESVSIRISFEGGEPPSGGEVTLPADGWSAYVEVGDFQFSNWCDDVIEWFEPSDIDGSNQRFEIVAGTFTMPANDAGTWCSGPVSVVVEGLVVDTPAGEATFDPITIGNDSFGCFAG